ncbi:hypothetical protein J6590_008948, partial [Homalodisca vitripennis]
MAEPLRYLNPSSASLGGYDGLARSATEWCWHKLRTGSGSSVNVIGCDGLVRDATNKRDELVVGV